MKPARLTGPIAIVLAFVVGAGASPASDIDRAIERVEAGDFTAAVELLEPLIRALSGDPAQRGELGRAHLYMGIAYLGLDQEKAARASFREALKLEPSQRLSLDRFPARVVRIFDDVRRESAPPATPAPATPAPAAAPSAPATDRASAAFEQGLAHSLAGRHAEAAAALREVVSLRPDEARAWYELGMTYARLGDKGKFAEVGRALIKLDRRLAEVLEVQAKREWAGKQLRPRPR